MHNSICRLCLKVTRDQWEPSNEQDVFAKIRSCLNLELTTNDAFPNQLCKGCLNKIDQIYEFYASVKHNQQILLQHLENESLTIYYSTLSNNVYIKEEGKIKKDLIVKHEKRNINLGTFETKENIVNVPSAAELWKENKINELENQTQRIKVEGLNFDINEVYSTDDDDNILLSSLKERKVDKLTPATRNEQEKHKKDIRESSRNKFIDTFNCITCDNVCQTYDELKAHYKNEHKKEKSGINETTFTEYVSNGNVMYKCDKCSKDCSKKNMKTHLLYHSNERPYVCKLCARTYKTVSDIIRHGVRAHGGHKMHCSYKCGFSTSYTGALKDHEDRIHKQVYKYTCEKCGKGFQVKTWYIQHQNIHTGLKPFVCDICGVAFHMDRYLTTHRSSMHPQSLDKKRLVCLKCDLKCDSVNSLALHLEKEHGVLRSKTKSQKTSLCDFCGKILNRPEQLQIHRRMHLGEKPYHCSICNKSFSRKFSLHVHERAHSRARPYTCVPCGTRYSQPSALYRHQRLHHGLPRKRA